MPVKTRWTLAELRQEMLRLAYLTMHFNNKYKAREKQMVEDGAIDYDFRTDILLSDASGSAQTCAALASSLAAVIQAEIAYSARFPGTPPAGTSQVGQPGRLPQQDAPGRLSAAPRESPNGARNAAS